VGAHFAEAGQEHSGICAERTFSYGNEAGLLGWDLSEPIAGRLCLELCPAFNQPGHRGEFDERRVRLYCCSQRDHLWRRRQWCNRCANYGDYVRRLYCFGERDERRVGL